MVVNRSVVVAEQRIVEVGVGDAAGWGQEQGILEGLEGW